MSTLENSLLGQSLGALAGQALGNQNALDTGQFSQWFNAQQQQQLNNGIIQQLTHASWSNPNPWRPFTLEDFMATVGNMKWTCTNPNCGKPLELAKRGKDKFQPKGVLILECKHCGFEFAVQAEVERRPKKENRLTETDFDLAALKKKVKEFELQ